MIATEDSITQFINLEPKVVKDIDIPQEESCKIRDSSKEVEFTPGLLKPLSVNHNSRNSDWGSSLSRSSTVKVIHFEPFSPKKLPLNWKELSVFGKKIEINFSKLLHMV